MVSGGRGRWGVTVDLDEVSDWTGSEGAVAGAVRLLRWCRLGVTAEDSQVVGLPREV